MVRGNVIRNICCKWIIWLLWCIHEPLVSLLKTQLKMKCFLNNTGMGKCITSESLWGSIIVWLHVLVLSLSCEIQAHLTDVKPLVNNYRDHDTGSCGQSMSSYWLRIWVQAWAWCLHIHIGYMLFFLLTPGWSVQSYFPDRKKQALLERAHQSGLVPLQVGQAQAVMGALALQTQAEESTGLDEWDGHGQLVFCSRETWATIILPRHVLQSKVCKHKDGQLEDMGTVLKWS